MNIEKEELELLELFERIKNNLKNYSFRDADINLLKLILQEKSCLERRVKDYSERLKYMSDKKDKAMEIIRCIKSYNINLKELTELGLQRYNAKYGYKGRYSSYFIPYNTYNLLHDFGILYPIILE